MCAPCVVMLTTGLRNACNAQVGYIRGLVTGLQAWGEWWEGGVGSDSPAHGNWSLTMDPSGNNFTGTWWYGSQSDDASPWVEQRVSSDVPAPKQCFLSTASPQGAAMMVQWRSGRVQVITLVPCALFTDSEMGGHYVVPSSPGTEYDVCVNRGWLQGSYSYMYDGEAVPGYETATCATPVVAPGGAVCTGIWFEPDGAVGIYMNVLAKPGTQWTTWWAGTTATLNYTRDVNNSDAHAVETEVLAGIASSDACTANRNQLLDQINTAPLGVFPRIAGTWNVATSRGYSGQTFMCVDQATGAVSGLTAGASAWRGVATGNTVSGYWLDAGASGFQNLTLAPLDAATSGILPNSGSFSVTYAAAAGGGATLTGFKWYDGLPGVSVPITFTSTTLVPPSPTQCFSPGVVMPLTYCVGGGKCVPWQPSRECCSSVVAPAPVVAT